MRIALVLLLSFLSMPSLAMPSLGCQIHLISQAKPDSKYVTAGQRAMALALDLAKMKPVSESNVFNLTAAADLAQLSHENLGRMLSRIQEIYPIDKDFKFSPEVLRGIDLILNRIELMNILAVDPEDDPPEGPIPSDFQARYDYFAAFFDPAHSVGFRIVARESDGRADHLSMFRRLSSIRLNDNFAREYGYTLPRFNTTRTLIRFFAKWQPEAIQRLIHRNRYNLPAQVRSIDEFLEYLDNVGESTIFPYDKLYTRLSALREELHRYVLTPADAEVFIISAYKYYLMYAISSGQMSWSQFDSWSRQPGFLQNQVNDEFTKFIMTDGYVIRIPIEVPASQYYYLPPIELEPRALLSIDSRRLEPAKP